MQGLSKTAPSSADFSSLILIVSTFVPQAAEKLGKSPGQILIRWLIQRGVSTIPKSSSDKRIKENMEVFDFSIPAEDMDKLSSISSQV